MEKEKKLLVLEDAAEQCFRTGRDSELFLDPYTGDLWKVSDNPRFENPDMSLDEALALEDDHQLLRMPKARDLHELDLMDEYIDYVPERLQRDLTTILRSPNPFQSYRSRLERESLLNDYYQYRNERGADQLEEFAEDHEIPYRHQVSLSEIHGFDVRKLNERDAMAVYQLARTNPQFYEIEPPFPSVRSVKAGLLRTPGGATMEQKYFLGFSEPGRKDLQAVMDLILDYPKDKEAWIGLLMVDGFSSHQGIGSAVVKEVEAMLAKAGIAHIELAVRPENEAGLNFWEKNGYSIKDRSRKDLWIFEKNQDLPEEDFEPEWEEQTEWTF